MLFYKNWSLNVLETNKNMQDPSRFAVASAPVAVASEVKAEDERQEQREEADDEEDEAMILNLFE